MFEQTAQGGSFDILGCFLEPERVGFVLTMDVGKNEAYNICNLLAYYSINRGSTQ